MEKGNKELELKVETYTEKCAAILKEKFQAQIAITRQMSGRKNYYIVRKYKFFDYVHVHCFTDLESTLQRLQFIADKMEQ